VKISTLVGLVVVVLAIAAPAGAHSLSPAPRALHAADGTVRFFENHPRLMHGRTRPVALAAIARAHATWQRLVPHLPLWLCIHGHEAQDWANRDTGGNGHYGGLQMHPRYGYGTSYHASDDPMVVQVYAAETAYRVSGYSRSWLLGQWAHYDCADRYA
jgi:hypothetical protein